MTDISDQEFNMTDSDHNLTSTRQELCRNCKKYAKEYGEASTIHGCSYITQKRSVTERIFWVFILSASLSGCIYMIYQILHKYNNTPVIVTFATEPTPIYEVPFPAITVCSLQHSRNNFNFGEVVKKLEKNETVDNEQMKNFYYYSVLCENKGLNNKSSELIDEGFYKTIDELKPKKQKTINWCFKMVGDKKEYCEEKFTPVIIDQGICYSYNILDRSEIFKKHVFHYSNYFVVKNKSQQFFNIELGYKTKDLHNVYPRRALAAGVDSAIHIELACQEDDWDFECTTYLEGFRVLIHNPWDVPRVVKQHFIVPLDRIAIVAIEPTKVTTSEAVRKFTPERRNCYLENERPLRHFLRYTQPNCLLECETNYTLKSCGCVQFFMPRDTHTAICGRKNQECIIGASGNFVQNEFTPGLKESICHCKPSCTSQDYNIEVSHSNNHFRKSWKLKGDVERLEQFKNDTLSFLKIYFKHDQFITKQRNELYGLSDLISQFGGLLGLFTGFSLISLVELLYFCSLRLYCNEKMYGTWSGSTN